MSCSHKIIKAVGDGGSSLWFEMIGKGHSGLIQAIKRHYPGSKRPISGRCMCWEITETEGVIGYIGLGDTTLNLVARKRLGTGSAYKLHESVCVFMYQLVDQRKRYNCASTILKRWESIASKCWFLRYGWRPMHWETFVNPQLIKEKDNPGACFKRAGYRTLGWTSGKSAQHYHPERTVAQNSRKIVLYKGPLARIPEQNLRREERAKRLEYAACS